MGHKHGQVHNSITLDKLSESDSKLYTKFVFVKEKITNTWKTHWSTKSNNLEDGASSVQVDILDT